MNYQLELDGVINGLTSPGKAPRLLLHACCAPCASYVLEYLSPHFKIDIFFYNPNIQPPEEYEKRLDAMRLLLRSLETVNPVSLLSAGYRGGEFSAASGLEDEPEGGARCGVCFGLRLREAAKAAKSGGYDYFCSTLTVGPRKNAVAINSAGFAAGQEYGVGWLPSDFKKRGGYQRSVELSKKLGLYRQNYCGCMFAHPKKVLEIY